MLNVYGITYDHTTNYGSCLQAYALQTVIDRITVSNDKCNYKLIPMQTLRGTSKTNFKGKIKRLIYNFYRKQFEGFENKYMHFSDIRNIESLPLLNRKADAFVCGSDVIWNPDYNHGLGAYYLDFAEKYKFSYAASFGKAELGEEDYKWIREKLASFDEISCREQTGVDVVRKCLDRPAVLVVDPVLLLAREDWRKIANTEKARKNGKYIFVYATLVNKEFDRFVDKLQKETGLKVIRSAYSINVAVNQRVIKVQKPEEWLGLLMNAEYIVTNSFHATAFSVLFHRNFFTFTLPGKNKGINIRMNDFLEELDLGERMISSVPDFLNLQEIDFSSADLKLERMCRGSVDFLQRNLENAYGQK